MKIMIVSDEATFLKSFYKMLPWKDLGMEVIADAESESSLFTILEEMEEHSCDFPNIIIVDIKESFLNKKELLERLESLNRGLFIVLFRDVVENHVNKSVYQTEKVYDLERGISLEKLKDYLLLIEKNYQKEREKEKKSEKNKVQEEIKKAIVNHTLKQVIEYINLHFEEKEVTLSFLANKFYIQKNYLCSLFKNEMNITVTDYIVELRMKKARNLMRTTGLSITEIAERVSYTDLSYFNRLFRKENGMGPREYKNMIKQK